MSTSSHQRTGKSTVSIAIGLDAVICAVSDHAPRVLTVRQVDHALAGSHQPLKPGDEPLPALPYGPLDPENHSTLEKGLRQWVTEQTGMQLGYVEQLYTFGDRFRDPREQAGGPRVISAAYLALVRQQPVPIPTAGWRDWYAFLPWEDWRDGRPRVLADLIEPALKRWSGRNLERRERADLCFSTDQAPWDPEKTLRRYELLYEAQLLPESTPVGKPISGENCGRAMAMDHRRILATALGRLRGKIKYRPVVFELLPDTFTLLQLQQVVEALAGSRLHKQNFRRLVAQAGLVEPTGQIDDSSRGRPAERYRFRREVLRERPAPGVLFSGAKWELA
jgi:hypothetical protein